ncbi:hypothetical protein O181_009782 [Austropuccinia psidii MF-1]|uniref:Uncharacterized protein n=1 Tax=Austropuccinia psidii MF-1 TaxID=1389203 RepID=A0A9Q3GKL8_9BASI|nr:hypothetical protein [Austropuccinia psidii MF-1]
MVVSFSTTLIFFSFLSACDFGIALPVNNWLPKSENSLQTLAIQYLHELPTQKLALDTIENEFEKKSGMFYSQEIVNQIDNLIESCYRLIEPRNRLVEAIPADEIVDDEAVEYLVDLSLSYLRNVMHAARLLKQSTENTPQSADIFQDLKSQYKKLQLLDEFLFKWASKSGASTNSEESSLDNQVISNEEFSDDNEHQERNSYQKSDLKPVENMNEENDNFGETVVQEIISTVKIVTYAANSDS